MIQREADGFPSRGGSPKGNTRKIADLPEDKVCRNPEHNPPGMIVYEPGIYKHTCPGCGTSCQFTVQARPTMQGGVYADTDEFPVMGTTGMKKRATNVQDYNGTKKKKKRDEAEWPEEPWQKAGSGGFNGHDSVYGSYTDKK